MGATCSGDRKGYVQMDELWVQTFREISLRTRRIYISAIQHVRSGRISQDKLKDYCEAEIKSVRLLPQELLDALWRKYDKNHDDQLTLDEFKELVDDYLRHAEKEAPQELAETMLEHFTAAGMTEEEARKYIENPAVRERMEQTRAALLRQIEKWRANIRTVIDDMLKQLMLEENAYIPREAFMKSFATVCESVCDLNTFKGTLFNVHATGADQSDMPAVTPRRRRRMSFMDTYAC